MIRPMSYAATAITGMAAAATHSSMTADVTLMGRFGASVLSSISGPFWWL